MKVVAALSGGVDSAVAAARAVDAGHEVTGVHLALSRSPRATRTWRDRMVNSPPSGMASTLLRMRLNSACFSCDSSMARAMPSGSRPMYLSKSSEKPSGQTAR